MDVRWSWENLVPCHIKWGKASCCPQWKGEESKKFMTMIPDTWETQITWNHWLHGQKDEKKQKKLHGWQVTGEGGGWAAGGGNSVLCSRDEPRFYWQGCGQWIIAGEDLSEIGQAKEQCVADVVAKHEMRVWETGQHRADSSFPSPWGDRQIKAP